MSLHSVAEIIVESNLWTGQGLRSQESTEATSPPIAATNDHTDSRMTPVRG